MPKTTSTKTFHAVDMGMMRPQKAPVTTVSSRESAGRDRTDSMSRCKKLNTSPVPRTDATTPPMTLGHALFSSACFDSGRRCPTLSPPRPAAKKRKIIGKVFSRAGWRMSTVTARNRQNTPSLKLKFRLSMGNSFHARLPPRHHSAIPASRPDRAASL